MSKIDIKDLWNDGKEEDWDKALAQYWEMDSVKRQIDLEKEMNDVFRPSNLNELKNMNGEEFYSFLYSKYFVWKYTAHNRLATTRKQLEKQKKEDLCKIRDSLFILHDSIPDDIELILMDVQRINGLGVAGGSGLLSILFPESFGTVDQFLVDSLCKISSTMSKETATVLSQIVKENIKLEEGVFLEKLLKEQADRLNEKFSSDKWTPRKIDMVLWAYR
ncbi:MAG: hypothetical protein K6B68_16930 [Eubacterium sp.]|nr:hypothetical protein [Eubacterium sp.]